MDDQPQKSIYPIILASVLTSAIVFGGLGYYLAKATEPETTTTTPKETTTTANTDLAAALNPAGSETEATATPTAATSVTPTSDKTYKSSETQTELYKSLKSPFTFSYPSKWSLSEEKGGIYVGTDSANQTYGNGAVPSGQYQVTVTPSEDSKNTEAVKTWCENNVKTLYKGQTVTLSSGKAIKVDSNDAYQVDYTVKENTKANGRQVCINKNSYKYTITGEQSDTANLALFDQLVTSFKFDK